MPTTTLSTTQRAKVLGAFLKRIRSIRAPEVPPRRGERRRVRGLRREEVAVAAGISQTWYTWIEQGRPVGCSSETLRRIASALRMDAAERKHLFDLAMGDDERDSVALVIDVPDELTQLVDAMRFQPAYVLNAVWDVLYFNTACAAVLGPFERGSRRTGNVLRRLFLDEAWRERFEDWEDTARSAVAQFRSATGPLQTTDAFSALVSELADESVEFRTMWDRRRLALPPLKRKIFDHPTAGRLVLRYASMRPDGAEDGISVTLYVPEAESFDAVRRLIEPIAPR